jgi:hypothetical protein
MAPAWMHVGCFALGLLICMGCRTPQPQLEPPKQPEVLHIPPVGDARYDSAEYPQQALAVRNKERKLNNSDNNPIMPARAGGFGRPGAPGGIGGF